MDDDQRHTAPVAGLGAARGPGPSRAPRAHAAESHLRSPGRAIRRPLPLRRARLPRPGRERVGRARDLCAARYVDDVVKLLDALEIPAAHILGTSLGGLYKG